MYSFYIKNEHFYHFFDKIAVIYTPKRIINCNIKKNGGGEYTPKVQTPSKRVAWRESVIQIYPHFSKISLNPPTPKK